MARFSGLSQGFAEFIVPAGFFHAQSSASFHVMEELSPNVRMTPEWALRQFK
jgi:hypothetical protein